MEVKINRDIREYTETMFFGLSLRQFLFSVLACGAAGGIYFLLHPYLGTETVSWVCVLGAAPFAVLVFFRYHGMNAEQFIWAWLKSEIMIPKHLVFCPENLYYEAVKSCLEQKVKEGIKQHDKGIGKCIETRQGAIQGAEKSAGCHSDSDSLS